jgi:hypothetical protein
MLRLAVAGLLALAVCAGRLPAAETKGKLAGVDTDKGTVTLTVEGKDRVFTVPKDAEFLVQDIRPYKPKEGLKDPVFKRKGLQVTVTTEKKGGKEVVTKIVVYTGRKG